MAFLASGIKPGDHVAMQDRSWISPAHVAHLLSLSILLVDVKNDRPVIDFTHFLKVIRRKPKVVVIVHMNGRSENLKEIADICATEGIFLIEDAAQAIGSKSGKQFLGTFGDIGCFSLAISKTVSSGQGGFCVTNNPILYEKLVHLRTHGVGNVFEPTWSNFGMNFRYTDPQASIALNQLTKLESRIKKQHENRFIYTDTLKHLRDVKFLQMNMSEGESGPYFDAWTHNGAEVAETMKKLGVECRRFYPSIASANYLNVSNRDEIVNAVKWHEHGIVFPSGPELTLNQLTQVTETVIQKFK
jgi:dTDP-4-amino-4,6-dideoxygalactose transaminase